MPRKIKQVSIPFREDLHSDSKTRVTFNSGYESCFHPFQGRPPFGPRQKSASRRQRLSSFHPFQGRPPFGQKETKTARLNPFEPFPSLSGKTSIRTESEVEWTDARRRMVSIPFREDLHSDQNIRCNVQSQRCYSFHPFQGRPPFGPLRLHPFQPAQEESFHPFQGRPPFGQKRRR